MSGDAQSGARKRAANARGLANLRPNPAWKPGVSGNPAGRPKSPVDIAELCRAHGPRGVEVAAALMEDPDPRIRLAAVTALWDRGFGKPVQALAAQDNAASLTLMHLVAARQFSAELVAERAASDGAALIDGGAEPDMPDLMQPALE